ncbi:MAG: hypothetical protein JW984_15235 [Deltaproteobacteria bacterium]|uniref:Uncharacterized protein n=1 Tax=Candidatus Zymogenus saltonus TaxID=2844893 RepID=A0A9D8PPT4_9DELT|nr:hypothetical protein [Candidatus Zymogenus saltonus]
MGGSPGFKGEWANDGDALVVDLLTNQYGIHIRTAANAISDGEHIWVSPLGDDTYGIGTILSPVASLTKAMTLVTATRKTIIMLPGEYDEADAVTWPDTDDVVLMGIGNVVISSTDSTTHVIGIDPAAASGTWTATLKNITLDHADGQVGLQVDNATVGKRINLILEDFATNADTETDASIDINRSGEATDAIRVYADGHGQQIEGLVTAITESTDDRFRFKGYRMTGGMTVVGAVACEVTLISVGMLTSGLTVDGANKLTNIHCWYETDANPNVYTQFADAYATY